MLRFLIAFFVVIGSVIVPAYASDQGKIYNGLSMVGTAKYALTDTHLSYANPNAPKGGLLKQSVLGSFDTLNPYNIKGKAAEGLNLVTDRLMARVWDEPFSLYPLIAQSVRMPDDRSWIEFSINPKARFHDNTPITSSDVLFSFNTLKQHGRPNMRRLYQLATPKVIDKQVIRFNFGEGYDRETALIFAMMPVLPKHYWATRTFDKTTLEIPLGSGPYKVSKIDIGKSIQYERVDDYWAKDLLPNKGHHNFDEIHYHYYRDDNVALESFKKGDLSIRREWDVAKWHSAYSFGNQDIFKSEEIRHGRAGKVRGFIMNTRRTPFDDINVRRAMQLLIDFDWMNKNLFHSAYKQVDSFFPNTALGRAQIQAPQQSMREKMRVANDLLNKAGWIVKEGVRIHKETEEILQFDILLDNAAYEKIALAYMRHLKKMGIQATIRTLDSTAYRGRLNEYDFDMILHYWHSTLSPGTEQYLYWSCESSKQKARWNYAGICDLRIDELTQLIPTAKTRIELQSMTAKLDQKLWDMSLFVPLYYQDTDYVAYADNIHRPAKTPLYGIVTETWWYDNSVAP